MSALETHFWTEKHRPKDLESIAMSGDNRALISSALEQGEIPHLLLTGPAGIGKTSLAFVVRDRLDCKAVVLNASKERGIDVVREKLGTFARGRFGARWNLIILDEADSLTRDAQTALRNMMETYANVCRFVLTANYPHRIIDPIQSRCVVVEMAQMDYDERLRVLGRILVAEDVEFEPSVLSSYAEVYGDLRRMINAAQRSVMTHGELRPAGGEDQQDGVGALRAALAGDWGAVVAMSKDPVTDHSALLKAMFWAVPDDQARAVTLRRQIAQAVHESGFTPDPVVHFLGACAEIQQTVEG